MVINKTYHEYFSSHGEWCNAKHHAIVAQLLSTFWKAAGISEQICYRKGCFLKHIFTEISNRFGTLSFSWRPWDHQIIIVAPSYMSQDGVIICIWHGTWCQKNYIHGDTCLTNLALLMIFDVWDAVHIVVPLFSKNNILTLIFVFCIIEACCVVKLKLRQWSSQCFFNKEKLLLIRVSSIIIEPIKDVPYSGKWKVSSQR